MKIAEEIIGQVLRRTNAEEDEPEFITFHTQLLH